METAINIRYLAWLYFEEVKPGHYDWNNLKHRVACRAYFVKLETRNEKAMKIALKKYIDTVKLEAAELKKG